MTTSIGGSHFICLIVFKRKKRLIKDMIVDMYKIPFHCQSQTGNCAFGQLDEPCSLFVASFRNKKTKSIYSFGCVCVITLSLLYDEMLIVIELGPFLYCRRTSIGGVRSYFLVVVSIRKCVCVLFGSIFFLVLDVY